MNIEYYLCHHQNIIINDFSLSIYIFVSPIFKIVRLQRELVEEKK